MSNPLRQGRSQANGWRARLVEEHQQLSERIAALQAFTDGPEYDALPILDQDDLRQQLIFMRGYANILTRRVDRL